MISSPTQTLLFQAQTQLLDWIENLLKAGLSAKQIADVIRSTMPMIDEATPLCADTSKDLQNLKVTIAGLDLDGF